MHPNIWSSPHFSSNCILTTLEAKTKHILVSHKLVFCAFLCSKCILCPRFLSPKNAAPFSWHCLAQQLARLHCITLITQTPFKAVHSSWLEEEGGSLPGVLGVLKLSLTSPPTTAAKSSFSQSLTSWCTCDWLWSLVILMFCCLHRCTVLVHSTELCTFFRQQKPEVVFFCALTESLCFFFHVLSDKF